MEINEILEISPYSLSKDQKRELLNNRLHELTRKHYEQCLPYRRMMDAMELDMDNLPGYEKLHSFLFVYLRSLNFAVVRKMKL